MGNIEPDVKTEEAVDTTSAKPTSAKTAEKKTETKPAATAKPAEKKATEKKPEVKKAEEKKPEPEKQDKKAEPVEEIKDVKIVAEQGDEVIYPYDVILKKPISTYRGPSIELLNRPFGGKLTVLAITGNFYKVQFVRAGLGLVVAYVLCEEVQKWSL